MQNSREAWFAAAFSGYILLSGLCSSTRRGCGLRKSGDAGREGPLVEVSATDPDVLPRIVKVEANLLRLPLFALHTKGLRALDGIECRGRLARDEVAHEFTFRAYRSTAK